jgi:hypothetical protein
VFLNSVSLSLLIFFTLTSNSFCAPLEFHSYLAKEHPSETGMITIQEDTTCIFNLFIILILNLLFWWLRSNLWCSFSLLKVLHHIVTVILRRLYFSLLVQLVHFKFKLLDFSLQVIIFLSNLFITSFHTHLTCGGFIIG